GARCMGGAPGRDAGVPRSAWLCRRFDGRRRHDHRRGREPAGALLALLDRPWRRPAVRAQGGQATFHPRANGLVAARPGRDADRRRPGRKPDGLPPPASSDRATRRDGEGAAHLAGICSGDGGDARARALEGLALVSAPRDSANKPRSRAWKGSGGSGLSLRSDILDSVGELYPKIIFGNWLWPSRRRISYRGFACMVDAGADAAYRRAARACREK